MADLIAPRRILLKLMLGSLALAAAAGVLGVLAPGGRELVWRLVWTALVTSVGCALLMTASRFIEKPEMRPSSLAAMSVVVVEYLLCLALIWDMPRILAGRSAMDATAFTMLFIAVTGFPAVAVMRLLSRPTSRLAGIVGLILLGSALLMMLIGAWWPTGVWGDYRLSGGGWVVELYSFAIIACLIGAGPGDRRLWRWIGVAAAGFACALAIYGILSAIHGDPPWMFVWATIIAIVIAHANVSMYAPLTSGQAWLRWATIIAVAFTGLLIGMQITQDSDSELLVRVASASGICAACGSMAMAIIARMNKKSQRAMTAPAEISRIEVICPSCQKKQPLPLGDSACVECGLRFSIKIDEPRCETCGYLLYRLKSDRCPECGTPIVPAATIAAH